MAAAFPRDDEGAARALLADESVVAEALPALLDAFLARTYDPAKVDAEVVLDLTFIGDEDVYSYAVHFAPGSIEARDGAAASPDISFTVEDVGEGALWLLGYYHLLDLMFSRRGQLSGSLGPTTLARWCRLIDDQYINLSNFVIAGNATPPDHPSFDAFFDDYLDFNVRSFRLARTAGRLGRGFVQSVEIVDPPACGRIHVTAERVWATRDAEEGDFGYTYLAAKGFLAVASGEADPVAAIVAGDTLTKGDIGLMVAAYENLGVL